MALASHYNCYEQLYGAMASTNLRFTIDVLCRTMKLRFKNSGFADDEGSSEKERNFLNWAGIEGMLLGATRTIQSQSCLMLARCSMMSSPLPALESVSSQ